MKKIYAIFSLVLAAFSLASCMSETDMKVAENEIGYMRVKVETNVNSITRVQDVPTGYDAKKLHVEVLDAEGNVAKTTDGTLLSTDDFENSSVFNGSLRMHVGTYTIVAHSANWDGTQSGFNAPYYAGQTEVEVKSSTNSTASVECKLANVKVTVNYSDNFKEYVSNAKAEVTSSLLGVYARTFYMSTTSSAYFPVSNLTVKLTVNDDPNHVLSHEIKDVQPRDHYIINYRLSQDPMGKEGDIHVYTDDASRTYTYDISVPVNSNQVTNVAFENISATGIAADAFDGTSVTLVGDASGSDLLTDKVTFQYRKKGADEWTNVPFAQVSSSTVVGKADATRFTCTLTTLAGGETYEYQMAQVDEKKPANSSAAEFTVKGQDIYNGGFEYWSESSDAWYANESGVSYWDSSNPGSASMGRNVTTKTTSVVHGGSAAAQLASTYIVIKFAAASIYTGQFDHLVGTKGAVLNWGRPFTGRPVSLHGFYQYHAGSVNRVAKSAPSTAPAKNEPDQCQIYCALTTEVITVDNTDMSTFPNWETDSRVVAYGTLPLEDCVDTNGKWKEFNIPLVYHNTTTKPTHIIIVCSASKYGDYFHGSDSSVLYLDDFEMSYKGEPSVQ